MSRVAWFLIVESACVGDLDATALEDRLGIIGVVVVSSAAIALVVLVVVVDAALRAGATSQGAFLTVLAGVDSLTGAPPE